MKLRIRILLLSFLMHGLSVGQDYHYSSDQFGIQATSLGGAGTAGLEDYSMVYYNAAAMKMVEKSNLSISINAYQFRTFNQKNALGPKQDLKSSQLSVVPNILAGILVLKNKPKWRLGYNVLSKNNYSNKLDLQHQGKYDAVASTSGFENIVGSYNFEIHNNEYWAGIGIGYEVNKRFSIGLTHMGIYKSFSYRNSYKVTAQPDDPSTGDISTVYSNVSFNYWDVKIIFKPSILIHYDKFRLGATFTTPTLHILGKGNFEREFTVQNLDDAIASDLSWIDREEGRNVKHQNSASIGYGISFKLSKKTWMHLSGETFLNKPYYLIRKSNATPNTYPTYISNDITTAIFGEQNFLSFGESYKSITNLGVGISQEFTPRFAMSVGARTDFNYNQKPEYQFERIVVQSTQYDRIIGAIGASYILKRGKKVSLAFELGSSIPKTTEYPVDFTTPNSAENGLLGNPAMGTETRAMSYKLMFEISLGKK